MANYYVVINKWSTTDENSPGYMSGLRVNALLERIQIAPLDDVLVEYNIPAAYFDLQIYTDYATNAVALSQTGRIAGFTNGKLPDNSLCYSMLLYNSQTDQNSLMTDDSLLINNFNTAKTAYMQLLNIQCETKRGMKDISDITLEKILQAQPLELQELEDIFSSL
jgi:hypothetical protein